MGRKLSDDVRADLIFDLVNSFRHLNSPEKVANFLEDLLTPTELRNLSVRLRIAKLLLIGKTQREICIALHTSLVTTNKVHNWLKKSGRGFKEAISRLPVKWEKPKKLPKGPIEYHLPELIVASTEGLINSIQEKAPRKLTNKITDK